MALPPSFPFAPDGQTLQEQIIACAILFFGQGVLGSVRGLFPPPPPLSREASIWNFVTSILWLGFVVFYRTVPCKVGPGRTSAAPADHMDYLFFCIVVSDGN